MNRKLISNSNYVLKKIFKSIESLDILQDFIEAFLKIKIKRIKFNSYKIINSKKIPIEELFGFANVRVITTANEEINIGIQFLDGLYIHTKLLLYYAQVHVNQLKYNTKQNIGRTITINIFDFNCFVSDEYHKKILIKPKDKVKNVAINENLELHIIELKKFICNPYIGLNPKEEWILYLIGEDKEKIKEILNKNEKIKKLDELLDKYWQEEKI